MNVNCIQISIITCTATERCINELNFPWYLQFPSFLKFVLNVCCRGSETALNMVPRARGKSRYILISQYAIEYQRQSVFE